MLKKSNGTRISSSLRYEHFPTATLIPRSDWNAVGGEQLFLSVPYLLALENSLSATMRFKYLLFYKHEIPVAIAVTQLLQLNTSDVNIQEFPCAISDALGSKILKDIDIKVLVCGSLFTCGEHGFAFTDHLTPPVAYEMLAKALRELRKNELGDKPSFLILKDFWPSSWEDSEFVEQEEFRPVHIDVNMVVDIKKTWSSFEDYLASMKTKFRTRAKKVLTTSSALIVQDFDEAAILKYELEITNLYMEVIANADIKVTQLSAETFRALKNALDNKFLFTGYFLNDILVGFSTAFILENSIEAGHIGIKYSYNLSHAIYQKMLYDLVNISIANKVSHLILGRTAELIKSSIGAQAVAMRLYVRHGNSISNTLLKPMLELVRPSIYETRSPFKTITKI